VRADGIRRPASAAFRSAQDLSHHRTSDTLPLPRQKHGERRYRDDTPINQCCPVASRLAAPQPARGPKDMTDYQAVVLHRDQLQLRRATPSYAVTRSAPARCADRSCPALSNAAAASSSIGE
jgi:hypothetical protein